LSKKTQTNERKRKKPKNRVLAWSFSFHLQLKNVNEKKKEDARCQGSFFSKYLTHRVKKKKTVYVISTFASKNELVKKPQTICRFEITNLTFNRLRSKKQHKIKTKHIHTNEAVISVTISPLIIIKTQIDTTTIKKKQRIHTIR
jgi:hypothetical protein